MTLSYDRRAAPELMAALMPGGFAHSLVEYGRTQPLDLQLRGYSGKQGHWATLYAGLTKVLDLHYRPTNAGDRFRLNAHQKYTVAKKGWRPAWQKAQPAEQLADEWTAVEDYLERAIPAVVARFLKEGAVQSAISGFASSDMVVIDREACVTFSNQAEKKRVTGALARPLLSAVAPRRGAAAWWKTVPARLGGECDAVAIDANGDVLAIEIKPAGATTTIRWAPLQVRHYTNLFTAWIKQTKDAGDVLKGMVDQREKLGLVRKRPPTPPGATGIKKPITVRPVVAIGRLHSKAALAGLKEVQQRLVHAGLNDPPLEICSVTFAGRLDPIA
ncbi:MAG: hypothetical protein M3Q30_00955 [Actinomycetota bacterium]|nr:hypothetical protein [Actinomycetota bacterium]